MQQIIGETRRKKIQVLAFWGFERKILLLLVGPTTNVETKRKWEEKNLGKNSLLLDDKILRGAPLKFVEF